MDIAVGSVRRLGAAVVLASGVGAAATAFAQTVDARGARELEADYAAYLGRAAVDKGIVAVAPDRDGYRVTWTLQKAVDLAETQAGALTVEPLVYRLVPGAGGTWTLRGEHLPRVAFSAPTDQGHAGGAIDFSGVALQGRYDPNSPDFLAATLSVAAVQASLRVQDADRRSEVLLDEKGVSVEFRARPGAGGGVDVALAQATQQVKQTVSTPGSEPDAGQINLNYEIGAASGGATLTGLRARELADLWKFAIARPPSGETAAMTGARPKLIAALPLFHDVQARAGIHDLVIDLPGGGGSLKSLDETLGLTGLSPTGGLQFGVDIQNFQLKSELAPAWTEALWPADLHMAMRATSEGWDKAARLVLDDPHFGEPGDLSAQTQAALASALVAGRPKFVVEPGHLATPLIDVAFEGQASLDGGSAAATFKVSVDSLDKLMALLAELGKTDEDLQAMTLTLGMFKGLAQTGDDGRLNWEIAADGAGHVLVNGQLMPTLK